jgi:leucyl-tRNA synthetase
MREQVPEQGAMIDWSREVVSLRSGLLPLETSGSSSACWIVAWHTEQRSRLVGVRTARTVLANEQVLDGNVCERCGTSVYRRDLEQWYFKITAYAEELLAGLDVTRLA